jgi:hypothetical protein
LPVEWDRIEIGRIRLNCAAYSLAPQLLFEFIDQKTPALCAAFADYHLQRFHPFFGFDRIGINGVVGLARPGV